jgi:opacity protein-like surface antigen
MRTTLLLLSALILAGSAVAGETTQIETATPEPGKWSFSSELETGYSYVGTSRTDKKNIDEQSGSAQFVLTSQYREGPPLRFGVAWQRFSFGGTEGTRLPNTLQSVSIIAGVDLQIFESIFLRLEAQPGWYSGSSRMLGRAFNVPVVLGGSYLVNKDLQFVLGVSFDVQRETYLLAGGGIRWQINDQLLANFILPKPRLEYKVSNQMTVYVGGDLFETSYRVDGDMGRRVNHPELNNAWLDYFEVRVGGGATLKPTEKIELDFELGYMAYREAAYQRTDITVHSDSGGLYGGVSLRAKF